MQDLDLEWAEKTETVPTLNIHNQHAGIYTILCSCPEFVHILHQ